MYEKWKKKLLEYFQSKKSLNQFNKNCLQDNSVNLNLTIININGGLPNDKKSTDGNQ